MNDVNSGIWATYELHELLASDFPGAWGSDPGHKRANVSVLRSTNLDDEGHIDYSTGAKRYLVPRDLEKKRLSDGDILLEASGGGPGKPVGRVALFKSSGTDNYASSNFFRTLRPRSIVDSSFLAWHLQWKYQQSSIWQFQQQTTGIINLKYRDYLRQSIALPGVQEQQMIAEILDTADEAIGSAERLVAKLEQAKRGLLHDYLTCATVESGQAMPLGEVSAIAGGVTLGRSIPDSSSIELPYLRVANVQDGFFDTSEMKKVRILRTELGRYQLLAGDVLMTEGGDFDKLGRGAVWDGSIDPCLHQNHIFRVRCDRSVLLPQFLAMYSASPAGRRHFVLISKQTTNLASINMSQLKAFPVPIPPLREQSRIVMTAGAQDDEIRVQVEGLRKLRLLKRGLMDDLLTGRVRVGVSA